MSTTLEPRTMVFTTNSYVALLHKAMTSLYLRRILTNDVDIKHDNSGTFNFILTLRGDEQTQDANADVIRSAMRS